MSKVIYRLASLALAALIVLPANGQGTRSRDADYFPRHEIHLEYGVPTIIELTSTINQFKDASGMRADNFKFSGAAGLGYNFFFTPSLSLGVYGGISYSSAEVYNSDRWLYRSEVTSYTFQIAGTWTYWEKRAMECSSAVYLGISYLDESHDRDSIKFAYHITAFRFRYGETIGGFAELGFGYRGLVNVGLSVKL